MNNKKITKIMAFLALIWIVLSIVSTWILYILETKKANEDYEKEIEKALLEYSKSIWSSSVATWNLELTNSGSELSTWNTN